MFQQMYGKCELEEATESWINHDVEAEAQELQSWEWVFGKTPKFEVQTHKNKTFEVLKGRVAGKKLPADVSGFLQNV